MASETPASRETQEQSIKARKHELFQPEAPPVAPTAPRKTVKEYLKDTRPLPMVQSVKAALWVAAVLVGLLFLAALITSGSRPKRRHLRPRAERSARQQTAVLTPLPVGKNLFS